MSKTPTLQKSPVDVLILGFGQRRVLVEEIGHKGQVEFRVARHDVSRRDKLSAAQPVCLLQHTLGSLQVIFLLQNTHQDKLRSLPNRIQCMYMLTN